MLKSIQTEKIIPTTKPEFKVKEANEKELRVKIANDRLSVLYKEFDEAAVGYEKKYFE